MSTSAGKYCRALLAAVVILGAAALAPWAAAENAPATTGLKVLVRADDAKFIGSGVGNLNIIVRNATTGELLAEGAITGPTGDTRALMQEPQIRGRSATQGDPANFQAELELARPTRVEVSVSGPLAVEQSIQSTAVTLWMIPGLDRVEQPLILHLPGLITQLLGYSRDADQLDLRASVTMICGCPITEDGLWPASGFQATAQLYRNDDLVAEAPLAFTGTDNEFAGKLDLPGPGDFQMVIHAHQVSTGNAGVYEHPLRVE